MKKIWIILTVIIVVVVLYGIWAINKAVLLDEAVRAEWAQVENQFQRRYDLIPNLVETVKGYAEHEQETLTSVVAARAAATSVPVNVDDSASMQNYMNAQTNLGSVLGRLIAISESYPDLKASENFLSLQSQLEGTENRIAVARHDYIQLVRKYNTLLRVFPSNIFISIFTSLQPRGVFEVAPEVKVVPKVSF